MNTPSSSASLSVVATALLAGCLHNGRPELIYLPSHTPENPGYTIQAPSAALSTEEATGLTKKVEEGGASTDQEVLNTCATHFKELLTARAQALCGDAMWNAYTHYAYASEYPKHPLQLPEVVAVSPNELDYSQDMIPHINAETAGGKPLDPAVADVAVVANDYHGPLSPDAQKAMKEACTEILLEPGVVWTEPLVEGEYFCSKPNATWQGNFVKDDKRLCSEEKHYSCFALYLDSVDEQTGDSSLALPNLYHWDEGVKHTQAK